MDTWSAGSVPEWLNGLDSKSSIGAILSEVRILPLPPEKEGEMISRNHVLRIRIMRELKEPPSEVLRYTNQCMICWWIWDTDNIPAVMCPHCNNFIVSYQQKA